jgi:AcrR family transcriptional regulator
MALDNQTPKTELADANRQRIVAGARRHFFANGFRTVTMDDLAQELGMSKKTIYTHFSSKAEIVKAMLMHKFSEVERDLDQITSRKSSKFPATLQELLACLQRHFDEIQPPFIRDMSREAPEMFHLIETRRRDILERHFGRLFREGQRAGIVRDDVSPTWVVAILLAAVNGIMNPAGIAEFNLTPKSGFSAIIRVVLEGVITSKGKSKL